LTTLMALIQTDADVCGLYFSKHLALIREIEARRHAQETNWDLRRLEVSIKRAISKVRTRYGEEQRWKENNA
jgi:hypothetical protein